MDFAARSVICPDMYIGTNEIGIPMVRRNKGVPPYDTELYSSVFSYVVSSLKWRGLWVCLDFFSTLPLC